MDRALSDVLANCSLHAYSEVLVAHGVTSLELAHEMCTEATLTAWAFKPFHKKKLLERLALIARESDGFAPPAMRKGADLVPSPAPVASAPPLEAQRARPAVTKRELPVPPGLSAPAPGLVIPPPAMVRSALRAHSGGPPPGMLLQLCGRCGFENLPNYRFCGGCGERAPPPVPVCRACGAMNLPDFRFCNTCGTPNGPNAVPMPALSQVAASPSSPNHNPGQFLAEQQERARREAERTEQERREAERREAERVAREGAARRERKAAKSAAKAELQQQKRAEEEARLAREREEEEREREEEELREQEELEAEIEAERRRLEETRRRVAETQARLAEEKKKTVKSLAEIQREEEEASRKRRAEEEKSAPTVPTTRRVAAPAKESFLKVTVAGPKQKAKQTAFSAVSEPVATAYQPPKFFERDAAVAVEAAARDEETAHELAEEVESRKAKQLMKREAVAERRAVEKIARAQKKDTNMKSALKAAAARTDLFSVLQITCKHSPRVPVECRLCESDEEKKQRVHDRQKRDETYRRDAADKRTAARKRAEDETSAATSMLLSAKKRNKQLGSVAHRVCEAWRQKGACPLLHDSRARRHNSEFLHEEEWRGKGDRAQEVNEEAIEEAKALHKKQLEEERAANTLKKAELRLARGMTKEMRVQLRRQKKMLREVRPN